MAIVRRKDNKGRVRYQVRVTGHRAETFDTLKEAQRRHGSLLNSKPRNVMTCGELLDRFVPLWEQGKLPRQKGKKPKRGTLVDRRQHFTLFRKEFGSTPLDELKPVQIETWCMAHKWAVRSVNPIFNYAVELELVEHNRFSKYMPHPGEGRKNIVPLTDEEVYRLADIAQLHMPQGRAFVLWQAFTGCRPSESYALDWPLDLSTDEFTLEHGVYEGIIDTPKTGARKIALLPQAKEALESIRGIGGPVFQTVWGRRLSNKHMSLTYWKQVRKDFGRDVAIYELRHYCAHLLYVRMDQPSRVVAAQLGNSPRLVENLYGHWKHGATDDLLAAIQTAGVPVSAQNVAHSCDVAAGA